MDLTAGEERESTEQEDKETGTGPEGGGGGEEEEATCLNGVEACNSVEQVGSPGEDPPDSQQTSPVEGAACPEEKTACLRGTESACPPQDVYVKHRGDDQEEVELESLMHEGSRGDVRNTMGDTDVQEQDSQSGGTYVRRWWRRPREIPARYQIYAQYRSEMWKLFKLAGPLLVLEFMHLVICISSIRVAGNRSLTELSIVAPAVAVFNILGASIGDGLARTFDTVTSQTFGSGNFRRVDVLLRRGIVIFGLASFPCWAVLIYTEPFFLHLSHNAALASVSQTYIYVLSLTVPLYFFYQLQVRHLQNQGHLLPQVATAVTGCFINSILIYFLLKSLQTQIHGIAVASLITYCIIPLFLYLIIIGTGIQRAKWAGWSVDCFQEWGSLAKMAFLSVSAHCLQRWMFEIWIFLESHNDWLDLGVRSMVYCLHMAAFTIPLGFSAAASVRVGKALGAGKIEEAKLASKLAVICGVSVGLFIGVFIAILKDYSGYIIFDKQEIVKKASNVFLLFSLLFVLDTAVTVIDGVLRGAGKLLLCAVAALIRLTFGLIISYLLMTNTHMGHMGLGIGILAGAAVHFIIVLMGLYRMDWHQAATDARKRAGVMFCTEIEMKTQGLGAEAAPTVPLLRVRFVTVMVEALSKKQLYLRRGLFIGAMVLIAAAAGLGRRFFMN